MKEPEIVEALKKARRISYKYKDGSMANMRITYEINGLISEYRAKERNRSRKNDIDRLCQD